MDIRDEILADPKACTVLVHRARLAADRDGLPLREVLAGQLAKAGKLRHALDAVAGLSLRSTLELIEDDRGDFERARANEREMASGLASFAEAVAARAESVIPGLAS